ASAVVRIEHERLFLPAKNPNQLLPRFMNAKMFSNAILVLSLVFVYPAAQGATSISGGQSGTLSLANSPYLATAYMFVFNGQTLTFEPAVVLQFQDVGIGAYIDGTLIARGTSGSPIFSTSD